MGLTPNAMIIRSRSVAAIRRFSISLVVALAVLGAVTASASASAYHFLTNDTVTAQTWRWSGADRFGVTLYGHRLDGGPNISLKVKAYYTDNGTYGSDASGVYEAVHYYNGSRPFRGLLFNGALTIPLPFNAHISY